MALVESSVITDTPKFRAWFGRSKVVDSQGQPLRCYHGTTQIFKRFSGDDAPDRGGLIAFFSTDPEFASNYAADNFVRPEGDPSPGANVMPVYLKIENPFDFRKDWNVVYEFWEEAGIGDEMEANRILMGLGYDLPDGVYTKNPPELTIDDFIKAVKMGSWDALEAPEFVRWLRRNGYDGVVLLENNSVNYGIFEPSQVRSALTTRR